MAEQAKAVASKTAVVPKKERHRSPNYPAVSLKEAVDRVTQLWVADGKAGAPTAIAAKHIGFGSAHGQALSVLAALKRFGLVAETNGRIVPTQRAMEIINLPADDPRRAQALKDAALTPTIYRELIEGYRETGLPADETLAAELTTYKAFNPNAVDGFVRDFKETLDFAGLNEEDALDSLEMQKTPVSSDAGVVPAPRESGIRLGSPAVSRPIPSTFIWPLAKDVTAQVTFSGPVTPAHLETLAKYLELAKTAIEAEEEQ